MQRPKTAVAGVLAGLALAGSLLATAGPANAAGTDSPASAPAATAPKTGHKGHGKSLCERVPHIEKRLNKALDRLNGDARTRGSIARMEARVKKAHAKGHEEVATFLQDRLTHRKELKPDLTRKLRDLKAVATWCEKKDDAKDGSGS
ncbi:hypothetical protein [Streptomyces platensis]|uniref:hypothetical protein n=1 Tax=Streptomyces platensis TaxID=58346 RepID=UPI001F3B42AB|nr:hypothetical protein [Streptomyces platensis]MCF3147491.1 hypothetical protein [Streptomyces platensis]